MQLEQERILRAYEARKDKGCGTGFFGYDDVSHVHRIQERHRETLRILRRAGVTSFDTLRVLDVGAGDGNMLRLFAEWGAHPERLAGIELRPDAVASANERSPHLDVRCGSATDLPWPDDSFDLVLLNTVFSSILDHEMKAEVAAEVTRVLSRGGAVLWYDFSFDHPRNPDVRGVKKREIEDLFTGFAVRLRRISLAPPIARCIPEPLLTVLYPTLAALPVLRTHYLGLLVKE